ncbi:unnamed protein product [Adineta steineri]|uniref:G-protein coupled receptors family 1 profile domain-containing protein n=1 Tax=Adineta steineri TaxID=433720 RepID=A0A819KLI8_9BILA|nr:unnamed protein product [Adineta steineri]
MSSTVYLLSIQNLLTRYGMSTYVAFGNIGNLLTIAVFCQSEQRRNSCSFYLLWMTICNLICLNVGIIPIIFSLDHTDISTTILIACKLQFYIRHTSFQIMRQYKVLACIDRFALCSLQVRIRSFSQIKIAKRLVIISGIFWILIVIFFAVVRTIDSGSCNIQNNFYALIYTIYYMIFAGILPPFLIILFSILVMKNLKKMRVRIQPTKENISIPFLRKRDRDLLKMVFVEVIFYVISTLPFSVYLIYQMITNNSIKSEDQKQIESFINYLTQSFIMYLNTALPFYIYLATSPSFRNQCKRLLMRFITNKNVRIDNTK